jgi:hypothetical protein
MHRLLPAPNFSRICCPMLSNGDEACLRCLVFDDLVVFLVVDESLNKLKKSVFFSVVVDIDVSSRFSSDFFVVTSHGEEVEVEVC